MSAGDDPAGGQDRGRSRRALASRLHADRIMSADDLDGPELDGLILELSSPARKAVAVAPERAKPAEAAPVAPPAPEAPAFRSVVRSSGPGAAQLVVPPRRRKGFLPAFSLPPLPKMPRIPKPRQVTVVRMCVGLGVTLSSAMPYWPYPKAGALWLIWYFFAIAMVVVAGIWSARLTWNTRLGVAHTVALCVVFWGITLAAEETIPRIDCSKAAAALVCP